MKSKLTITVEEALIPRAKQYARGKKKSLSALIEDLLKRATDSSEKSFSQKWRGAFEATTKSKKDPRFEYLSKRYLS